MPVILKLIEVAVYMPVGDLLLAERPTRVRYVVLGYLSLLTFILYLDRVCIGQAGPRIRAEMRISETELSYVFASFTLAYGLFMPMTGRLADRFGSRAVLTAIVLWWSVFTSLTGLAGGFVALLIIRFIFGVGEAGALPNCARVLTRWFPAESRGLPQGLLNTSALIGGAIAPFAAERLMDLFDRQLAPLFLEQFGSAPIGWRWTFLLFGLLGVVWGTAFWRVYRDDPTTHPRVNDAERAYILRGRTNTEMDTTHGSVPWRVVAASRNVWLMGLIQTCASCAAYFYMFWFPSYLQKGRGVESMMSGNLASLVLAGGALGSALGGLLSDTVNRRTGGHRRSRSVIGAAALGSAGAAIFASLACEDALAASVLVAFAYFFMMLHIASWWGVVNDISGRHVGVLFGLMNAMGVVGAVGGQILVGRMADYKASQGLSGRAQWDPAIDYFGIVLFIGALAWTFVDSNKSAVGEPRNEPCKN